MSTRRYIFTEEQLVQFLVEWFDLPPPDATGREGLRELLDDLVKKGKVEIAEVEKEQDNAGRP